MFQHHTQLNGISYRSLEDIGRKLAEERNFTIEDIFEDSGYRSDPLGEIIGFSFVRLSKENQIEFLLLSYDSREDMFLLSNIYVTLQRDGTLTGEYSGSTIEQFPGDADDDEMMQTFEAELQKQTRE